MGEKWTVEISGDDYAEFVIDASMVVSNGCLLADGIIYDEHINISVIIVIVLFIFILIAGIGLFLYFRSKRNNKLKKGVEVGDNEEEIENIDDEIEVNVETK